MAKKKKNNKKNNNTRQPADNNGAPEPEGPPTETVPEKAVDFGEDVIPVCKAPRV